MSKVFSFSNLVTPTCRAFSSLSEAVEAGQVLTRDTAALVRQMPKPQRRDFFKRSDSVWPCISLTEGVNPLLRISNDNPPQLLHGFAADYDNLGKRFTIGELTEIAGRFAYPPAAGGPSLSGEGVHAVWLFKEPIPVLGNADYARKVTAECYKNLRAGNFVQGFDEAFRKPDRLLSIDPDNFGYLTARTDQQLVDEVSTRLWASSVTEKFEFEGPKLDLAKVYEQVERLFPGRWNGPFNVGARGCRFWSPDATDNSAAVVADSGMVYFSDGGGFKPWSAILGRDVSAKLTAESMAQVTNDWNYDSTRREYVYFEKHTGNYATKNRTQFIDRLALSGLEKVEDQRAALVFAEDYKGVTAVVQLANQKRGLITQDGLRYINATRTTPIVPVEGECPFIIGLLSTMFGKDQIDFFLGWLEDSVRCALEAEPSYSQAVFLAGEVESGKSLVQYRILTPLLGGRYANPMPFLLGGTDFNSELADAGHWLVSDSEGAGNNSQKASFTQNIKAIAANPGMSVHQKYATPVTLFLNSRITFSLNLVSECLSIVPRLGSDIMGKLNLFKVDSHGYFSGMDKRTIESTVKQELPAFAFWLLNHYKVPAEVISSGRYRTKSYHAPELMNFARASQDSSELLGWLGIVFNQNETLRQDCFEKGLPVEFSASRWLQIIVQTTGHNHAMSANRLSAQFQHLSRQYSTAITSTLDKHTKVYNFGVNYKKLTEIV